jgi:hypothetical protein
MAGDVLNIKVSSPLKLYRSLTGKCFEMPNSSYTNRWKQFKLTANKQGI